MYMCVVCVMLEGLQPPLLCNMSTLFSNVIQRTHTHTQSETISSEDSLIRCESTAAATASHASGLQDVYYIHYGHRLHGLYTESVITDVMKVHIQ